jgi:uroporphyrinogen-III synthase
MANLPLSGLRILVGRARHQASALSVGLREFGAEVIEIPFIEIRKPASYLPLDTAIRQIKQYDWLILTSVNGAGAFWERLHQLGVENAQLSHLRIAAIGPATKKAIESRGLKVSVVPKEYVAESVVASLQNRVKGKRVLLARAKVARDVIPRELRKTGAEVNVVEAYETVVPRKSRTRLSALMRDPQRRPHVIMFTSSSTVRNFFALLGLPANVRSHQLLKPICFASIGPVTSATLRKFGFSPAIEARRYTIPSLIKTVTLAARKLKKG